MRLNLPGRDWVSRSHVEFFCGRNIIRIIANKPNAMKNKDQFIFFVGAPVAESLRITICEKHNMVVNDRCASASTGGSVGAFIEFEEVKSDKFWKKTIISYFRCRAIASRLRLSDGSACRLLSAVTGQL